MRKSRKSLVFGDKILNVWISKTEEERSQGLMNVKSIPENDGMLFIMDTPGPASFWMKNTLIPLDIAFLDSTCRILKIGQMEPIVGRCACSGPVKFVVEANVGWFERNGISVRDQMTMNDNQQDLKELVNEVLTDLWQSPECFGDIIYRPFSEKFYQVIREMKQRVIAINEAAYPFDEFHREALSTSIGEFGTYNGVKVPLDIPIPEVFHSEMFPHLYEIKELPPNTKLNQPKRGGKSKFHVYVKDPKTGNIKKIGFGDKGMSVGIHNPKRVKSFVARHNCHKANDKTTASYWSCRLPRYWKSLGLSKTTSKWW